MTDIQSKWRMGELPGISCLLYACGDVLVFNSYSIIDKNIRKLYCSPLCDTHINSLEQYNEDIWTNIDVYNTRIEYKENYLVSGDGSMGNEGFVACTDKKNLLIWAYFFDFSNPIVKLEVKDDILICYSDNEIIIKINMKNMLSIEVIYPSYKE